MLGQLSPCAEGTRTRLLSRIQEWMQDTSGSSQVFWLKGSLGSGKTAIAYTVAQMAQQSNLLGANFFFSRFDESLRDPRLLIPTIAFHLAHFHPAFKLALAGAVAADSDITHRQPAHQFEVLLRHASDALNSILHPVVFVFDALDEFEKGIASFSSTMRLLIHGLTKMSSNVRLLLTSRPEPYIERLMCSVPTRGLVHDLDADPETKSDISKFLRRGLAQAPSLLDLETEGGGDWFSERDFSQLRLKAGNSFVYAATALRFIADPVICDPRQQLDIILRDRSTTSSDESNPYANLDNLYMLVLQRAYPESTSEATLDQLRSIFFYSGGGATHHFPSNEYITHFTSCTAESIAHYLRDLGSVFLLSRAGYFLPRHRTFMDLLLNRARCRDKRFFIDMNEWRIRFALRCLETVKECCLNHCYESASVMVPLAFVGFPTRQMACNRASICCNYSLITWTWQTLLADPDDPRWTMDGGLVSFLRSRGFVLWLAKRLFMDSKTFGCSALIRPIWWNVCNSCILYGCTNYPRCSRCSVPASTYRARSVET
ncbi:hypothetical protein HGRIS_013709 [Hohenbuehelia grisea]|uniref:Nephrocystin 3-like N-terminal domain-containing protein n=1 Tax=Hohenbuehelia grisea TaxID=104357 RepID=A0ABR3IWD7_9AGAR